MSQAKAFVLLTVLIDSIGIGLIIPVLPALVAEIDGGGLKETAWWLGVLSASFFLMQFLFGPAVGNLSDRFGRKPVLITSLVVLAIDYFVMAMAQTMWLLLLGRIVAGIAAATNSTANAYMADISSPDDKAGNFGLVGAAFGIGFVIGPVLGGFAAEAFGLRAPFYLGALLAAANALFGYFVLKETVDARIRRPFEWRRANPFGALKSVRKIRGLLPLLAVYFLYQLAFASYSSIWAIYTGTRYGWSEQMIGVSLSVFGISYAMVTALLVRPSIKWLGERGCVLYGHIGDVFIFAMIGLLSSGMWLLILTPLAALPGVITPALQGMMSKAVADDAQGELQGVITSVTSIAMIPAPLIMTSVFAAFSVPNEGFYLPGAPYFLSSLIMMFALMLFLRAPVIRARTV